MTEDHVIDGRKSRCDELQIREHSVARAFRLIVVRSRIIDYCEIGTTNQYAETGAHINYVDGEGWRRCRERRRRCRNNGNHSCPTLGYKPGQVRSPSAPRTSWEPTR